MKKILSNFKRIFTDNKEYFVKCTIMSVIAAFILGLTITLTVPASAAGDPIESDQVVIPAGIYRFNDLLTVPSVGFDQSISFSILDSYIEITQEIVDELSQYGINVPVGGFTVSGSFSGIRSNFDNLSNIFVIDYDGGVFLSSDERYTEVVRLLLTDGDKEVYNSINDYWDVGSVPGPQTISIPNDTSVDSNFASWFYSNVQSSSDYIIEAGFYKARDNWNVRYFPALNDAISFRYYDGDSYITAYEMAFVLEYDAVIIYYSDVEAYFDGWAADYLQNIEIIQDTYVDLSFYQAFNSVFELSSSSSNDFDIGYSVGYDDGFDEGYRVGHNQGYLAGLGDSIGSSDTFLGGVVENVLDALDKLVIVGDVSILDILKTLIGAFVVIFFLKLIAGG